MAKRGAREGSVYHRTDGRWCGSYQVALSANGARRRTYVYGTTQADVLEKLAKIRGESASGVIADPGRLKLGEYLARWLDETARPRVRPATYNIYGGLIRLHIAPYLGGVKMKTLAPVHIQALHREIEKVGGSPRKRQMVHAMLRVALRDACRLGLLPRNPCDGVARPRAPKPEIRLLDVAETRLLLKASTGDPLEALYAVAVGSGLRLGELLGLTWRESSSAERDSAP